MEARVTVAAEGGNGHLPVKMSLIINTSSNTKKMVRLIIPQPRTMKPQ